MKVFWINPATENKVSVAVDIDTSNFKNTGGEINTHLPDWMLLNDYVVPFPYEGMIQHTGTVKIGMWIISTTKTVYNNETSYSTRYENKYL